LPRIDLNDTPFRGVNRSYSQLIGHQAYAECRSCGSSLAGRREAVRWSVRAGVRYAVEVYRCRCGRGRQVRRPERAAIG
jgi:hypothetical protein